MNVIELNSIQYNMNKSIMSSFLSALCLSLIFWFLIADYNYFSIIGFLLFFIVFFVCYLFIATPIQIILNKNNKKFILINLIIYTAFSGIIHTIVFVFYGNSNPLQSSIFYSMILCSSVVFWFIDSLFSKTMDK
ncbi:hypothetical protein CWS20_22215 [Cytobacillus horneckiae]|uniref:Permease n=3 Tax=Cytobacillus horneckiae TaxID=549687 RepID=A0A2N0ZBB7_9BACI|nr:hypothetical protein CWS20_22215 [Cytobacillus horneckiae]